MYAALRLSILGFLLAATGRRLVTVAIPPETIIGGISGDGPIPPSSSGGPVAAVALWNSCGGSGVKRRRRTCVSLYDFSLSARHVLATSSRRFPYLRVWNLSCPLPEQGFFHEVSLIP
ncbi:hypothetical protein FB451DRAFT_1176669 [Mycena latifolia]|nr:hypothetical protein FB451DRAFT_1176669 [Mycena latifolia]